MKSIRSVSLLIVLFVFTACGGGGRPGISPSVATPAQPAPAPQQSSSPAPGASASGPPAPAPALVQMLNLKLVSGVKGASGLILDSGSPNYLGSSDVTSDQSAVVPSSILLPVLPQTTSAGTPDLFFIVSKQAFPAAAVRQVFYQMTNGSTTEVPLAESGFDSGSGVFYVPLSSLFGSGWSQVNPSDQHNLILDVMLENNQSYELTTSFSMTGFPAGTVFNGAPVAAATAAAFTTGVSRGQTFFAESVSNSSAHPVTLWIRVAQNSALTLQTRLRYSGWQAQNEGPDPANSGCSYLPSYPSEMCHPIPDEYSTLSSAAMTVASVAVTGSQSAEITDVGDWSPVPLASHASVTLGWQAVPTPGPAPCLTSGTSVQLIDWKEVISSIATSPVPFYKPHPNDAFGVSWTTEGAELSGTWTRELRIAENEITADQLNALEKQSSDVRARVIELPAGPRVEGISVGVSPIESGTTPDRCQGPF